MADITWVASMDTRVANWEEVARQLRAHEGQWGLVFTQAPMSWSNLIREGKVPALRYEDGFRMKTRNNSRTPPRLCDIYLAYKPREE